MYEEEKGGGTFRTVACVSPVPNNKWRVRVFFPEPAIDEVIAASDRRDAADRIRARVRAELFRRDREVPGEGHLDWHWETDPPVNSFPPIQDEEQFAIEVEHAPCRKHLSQPADTPETST